MVLRGRSWLLGVVLAGSLAGCDLIGLKSISSVAGPVYGLDGGSGRLSIAGLAPVELELERDSERSDIGPVIHLTGDDWDVIVFVNEPASLPYELILRRDDGTFEAIDRGYRCTFDIADTGTAVSGSISCIALRLKPIRDRDNFTPLDVEIEFDVRG